MNYKQQLIHEAVEELRKEDPGLLRHVTDITCDWTDNHRNVRYWLVYRGAAYIIKEYKTGWEARFGYLGLWRVKKDVETDPGKRRVKIDYIKQRITQTVQYAEKTFGADRRGQYLVYPGLAQ